MSYDLDITMYIPILKVILAIEETEKERYSRRMAMMISQNLSDKFSTMVIGV